LWNKFEIISIDYVMNDKEDLAARLAALIADQERPLEIICDEQTKLVRVGCGIMVYPR